jgi:hypothetical protein
LRRRGVVWVLLVAVGLLVSVLLLLRVVRLLLLLVLLSMARRGWGGPAKRLAFGHPFF